jgi:hypothetical protein
MIMIIIILITVIMGAFGLSCAQAVTRTGGSD